MAVHNKAIVTLAIGSKYEKMFEDCCSSGWRQYCRLHGYDLIVINYSLDATDRGRSRSPAWQKLLILSQEWSSSYEQIVWVDADVIINSQAPPCVASLVPVELVGAVESYSIPSRDIHRIALRRSCQYWRDNGIPFVDNLSPGLYYKKRGIEAGAEFNRVVQTGVFVCSPRFHRDVFEAIYYEYEDVNKSAEWNYEMPAMSYELVKNDLVHWLPAEYNFCVLDLISAFYPFIFSGSAPTRKAKIAAAFLSVLGIDLRDTAEMRRLALSNICELGYFVHFAGCPELMMSLPMSSQGG